MAEAPYQDSPYRGRGRGHGRGGGHYRGHGGPNRYAPPQIHPRLRDPAVEPAHGSQHNTSDSRPGTATRNTHTSTQDTSEEPSNNFNYGRRSRGGFGAEEKMTKAERERKKAIESWTDGPPPVWLTGEKRDAPIALYTMYSEKEPPEWDDTPLAERFRRNKKWVLSVEEPEVVSHEELEKAGGDPLHQDTIQENVGSKPIEPPTPTLPVAQVLPSTGIRGVLPAIPGAIKPMKKPVAGGWDDPLAVDKGATQAWDATEKVAAGNAATDMKNAIFGWATNQANDSNNPWQVSSRGRGRSERGRGNRGRGRGGAWRGRARGGHLDEGEYRPPLEADLHPANMW